jgi:hypothetical protein
MKIFAVASCLAVLLAMPTPSTAQPAISGAKGNAEKVKNCRQEAGYQVRRANRSGGNPETMKAQGQMYFRQCMARG